MSRVNRPGTASQTPPHTETQLRRFFYGCTLGVIEISSDRFSSCVQSKHVVLPAGGAAINETDGESRVRSEALKRLRAKRVAMEVQRTFYNGGSSSIGSSSVLLGEKQKGLKWDNHKQNTGEHRTIFTQIWDAPCDRWVRCLHDNTFLTVRQY